MWYNGAHPSMVKTTAKVFFGRHHFFPFLFSFQVPILDRASFEVRLLACVWLVAPGPPESSLASWEDQQEQMHWQDGEDSSGIGMPPSPGAFSVRRGGRTGGAGAGGSPKTPATTVSLNVGFCIVTHHALL